MAFDKLKWKIESSEVILHTPIFDIEKQKEVSATGYEGNYIAIDSNDWCMVIPHIGDELVLVRQWRHGSQGLTLEFPGGVIERGEDLEEAAKRELSEETGLYASELIKLGSCSPNPAIFKNKVHFYYVKDPEQTGITNPDEDEFIDVVHMKLDDVVSGYGIDELTNALTGTAISFLLRYLKNINN